MSSIRPRPFAPVPFERLLAYAAIVMLLAVLAAILRGSPHWRDVPSLIWAHLLTIALALSLTPVMLLRPRGDRLHRRLGWLWVASLASTAALSFGIRTIYPHHLSAIHALSALTLALTPLIVWSAHKHRARTHRVTVCVTVASALLIAGFFTFPFHRMLGRWLMG